MQAVNAEMYSKLPTGDMKSYLRLNQSFHFMVYQKCGKDDLVDLIELLWMRYDPMMNIVRSGILSETGQLRHGKVFEAIHKSDAEKRLRPCAPISRKPQALFALRLKQSL